MVIKHGRDENGHAHTVAIIEQDSNGQYWLSLLCKKRFCPHKRLIKLLPAQVDAWLNNHEATAIKTAGGMDSYSPA